MNYRAINVILMSVLIVLLSYAMISHTPDSNCPDREDAVLVQLTRIADALEELNGKFMRFQEDKPFVGQRGTPPKRSMKKETKK